MSDLYPGPAGAPAVRRADAPPRGSVLLICPVFFSYHLSIAEELRSRGFEVVWWDDRPTAASAYKVALRLLPRWVATLSNGFYRRRVQALSSARDIQHVLVVKGEALSARSVARMREAWPHARFIYYLWDGVENARGAPAIAPLFDTVATFDPRDARRFGWSHRPLFARRATTTNASASAKPPPMRYDWSFVGTLHSDRFRVVQRLMRSIDPARIFAFGYLPGRMMWMLRHAVDWRMLRPGAMQVSTQPMATNDIEQVVQASRAIVDVEHPRQRGLTMRTIETLLAGRKLVTTNAHIRDSDLYDERRVCIIDRSAPEVPETFLASPFPVLTARQQQRYSLSGWVEELLGLEPEER